MNFLIYNAYDELVGKAKYAEEAAMFVSALGDNSYVKDKDSGILLWKEGVDGSAAESYDNAADVMRFKIHQLMMDN